MIKNILKYLTVCFCLFLNSFIFSQDYFPLQIGNRWDYSEVTLSHGGGSYFWEYSVKVLDNVTLGNGFEYFLLSNSYLFGSNLLRLDNDSLFCFRSIDSTDCLLFVFNQAKNSSFFSCVFDSTLFFKDENYSSYGIEDTQKTFVANHQSFEFSKNFGLIEHYDWTIFFSESKSSLEGCLIDGVQYGDLIDAVSAPSLGASVFRLDQNHPNPFNPITIISYYIPKDSFVKLIVANALSQPVKIFIQGFQQSGFHEFVFDAEDLSSGVYFYSLITNEKILTKKLVVLK